MKKAGREARKIPCARAAVESHPFGFPLGFARGFGKTGQALFAKCAKKDGAPDCGVPLIAKNAMSGASAQSEG